MRNIYALFITISIIISSISDAFAAQVDSTRAMQSALGFFSALTHTPPEQLLSDGVSIAYRECAVGTAEVQTGTVCFYVVNVGRKGFVMLSGDDRLTPILGYSNESSFSTKNMPENLRSWLEARRKEIASALESGTLFPSQEIIQQWNHLSEIGATTLVVVQPLLQTTWNQNAYYNKFCPSDPNGPNGHAYAGCVATAMAQIIRYWQWPWSGFNSHSYTCDYGSLSVDFSSANYNFNNMPNYIYGGSTSTQIDAVATLTYHCGVSVDMDYSPDGSGAYTVSVSNALRRFFAYANFGTYVNKADYSHSEWDNLIQNELNNDRPVYYSGSSEDGGHAFVCDGYDNNGNYHFNWGWSGYYNGYFTLNALTPGASHDYSENQEAIIGISAIESSLCCSEKVMSFYTPVGGESLAQILTVRGHSLNDIITITVESDFTISANGNDYGITATLPSAGGNLYVKYTPNSEGNVLRTLTLNSGSITESVSLSGNPIEVNCFPPQDLTGAYQGASVKLSWNVPISYANNSPDSTTLSWDSTVTDNFYSIANDITYCMVHRFEISDLSPYHQYQLTKVSFVASPFADSYRIVVYKGGNYNGGVFNPGELVLNQVVPMGSINVIGWNTVTLGNPVMVDASQELWFGVIAYSSGNNGGAYVIRLGTNAAVDGYGNLLGLVEGSSDGTDGFDSWISLDNGNFPIKGTVEKVSTCGIHYDVYRRNTLLGSTGNTSFIDNNPLSDTCTYVVSSVWDNDCSEDAFVTVNSPVITLALDNIFGTDSASATAEATVVNNGGSQITSCGVCWSTSPNPTLTDNHSISVDYTDYTSNNNFYAYDGKFTSALTGISKDTIYYVRAYATNEYGTAYSEQRMYVHFDNLLDVNNIAAYFSVGALQYQNNNAIYRVPKVSQTSTIYGHSLWLGGVDDVDSLHLSAGSHSIFADVVNFTGISACEDFWPGPLSTINASTDSATVAQWNRCFKITREEVLDFLLHYDEPGYTIPFHIVSWPAHGDTAKGQAYNIAPFVDVDGDNHYNPSHGDYPSFPGDMALFFVFNDKPAKRTPIGGMPIGVEVHTMVYGYDAPQDSVLNNTLFVKYKLFNRSQTDIHEAYASLWTDWDVGDANDDRVGCCVKNNTAYAYNATTVDGSGLPAHYGPNPPIQTLTILGGPRIPADELDNPSFTDTTDCGLFVFDGNNQYAITGMNFGNGIVDDERMGMTGFISCNNERSVEGDPCRAMEFYNLMRNRWKVGTHLFYGGDAYSQAGAIGPECRFLFPGTSDPCNWGILDTVAYAGFNYQDYGGSDGWREETVGWVGGDRRGVVNMGPFDFAAGSMQEIDYCMTTLFPTYTDTTVVTAQQLQSIDTLLHQYADNQIGDFLFVPEVIIDETICAGGEFEFRGTTYTAAGNYSALIRDHGRDTVVRIHLTAMENPISSVSIPYMCSGSTYALTVGYNPYYTITGPWIMMMNDSLFVVNPPADIAQDTVVPYYINMQYDNTCEFDTTVFITCYAANLTLKDTVVCENELPFEWNGVSFTEAGFIYDTLLAVNGCDSVVMINLNVTNCGVIVDEKSCPAAPTVTDIDGNVYGTVQIGGQCWMRENLRTTKYANGVSISQSNSTSTTIPYWYYPDSNPNNKNTHGLLYNWKAVMRTASSSNTNPSGVQGICPTGWHLPSYAEWNVLTDYISNQTEYSCGNNPAYIAKSLASKTGWSTGSGCLSCSMCYDSLTNNSSGFNALPAGAFYDGGSNYIPRSTNFGHDAVFWSSTEYKSQSIHNVAIVSYIPRLLMTVSYISSGKNKHYGYSVRCVLDDGIVEANHLPTVTSDSVTGVTKDMANCFGSVLDEGGSNVTEYGFCWNTTGNPTISDSFMVVGSGQNNFTLNLSGLDSNTTYYVKAYATNSQGTSYGEEISFTTGFELQHGQPCTNVPTLTDIDGNVYNTVRIGSQCWMKENVRTTKYADGIPIQHGNAVSTYYPYWYYPNNNSENKSTYGLLYNWKAATRGDTSSTIPSRVQGICPDGWHIPSVGEWKQLTSYVSSQNQYICGNDSSNISKALASTGGWKTSMTSCTVGGQLNMNNTTGLSLTPAGYYDGSYTNFGYSALFRTCAGVNSLYSENLYLYYNYAGAYLDWYGERQIGMSVRCILDEITLPSVITNRVANITQNSVVCYGTISSDGGDSIAARGFCWNQTGLPTTADSVVVVENGTNYFSFASYITNLIPGVTYYIRAYATNSEGTSYGEPISFTTLSASQDNQSGPGIPCPGTPTVTDHEGNVYNTVQIGDQCWTKENLRTTTSPTTGTYLISAVGTISSYTGKQARWYNDDPSVYAHNNYGLLYNWNAAMDTFNTIYGETSVNNNSYNAVSVSLTGHRRGICPEGWHLPSDAEWLAMEQRQTTMDITGINWRGNHAGKLAGSDSWIAVTSSGAPGNYSNTNRNASGFSAVPAGQYRDMSFYQVGQYAHFWTSEEDSSPFVYNTPGAWVRALANSSSAVSRSYCSKNNSYSVRCLRDSVVFLDTVPPVFNGMLPDGHVCPSDGRFYVPDFTTYFTEETVSDNSYPFSSLTVAQTPVAGTEIHTDTEVTVTLTDPCGNERLYQVEVVRLYWSGVMIDSVVCESGLPVFWNGKTLEGTGTYYDTLTNSVGCDSIVIFHLVVNQSTTYTEIVDTCDSFTWINGVTYTESGVYPFLLTNSSGCDSIVTLHLTVNHADTTEFVQMCCYQYSWNGITYTETGDYSQILSNQKGCDSLVIMHLTVMDTVIHHITAETCGDYIWNNSLYTTTGNYTQTFPAANGCDSVVTLHLIVHHSADGVLEVAVVENDLPYYFNGHPCYATGTYTDTMLSINGCDSILTLYLTVLYNLVTYENTTVCSNLLPAIWQGHIWTEGGTVIDTFLRTNGTDSIVVKTMTVNTPTESSIYDTVLENSTPYILNGIEYVETGDYQQTITNSAGCDSTISLHLVVLPNVQTEIDSTICDDMLPIVWNGIFCAQSGNYTHTLTTVYGADSIVTLHLTVNLANHTNLYQTACDSYTWRGETYTESGDYPIYLTNSVGCDSIVTLHLIINSSDTIEFSATACNSYNWNGITYTESGDYMTYMSNASGCNLVVILHLTINNSDTTDLDVTACDSYSWNGATYYASGDYVHTFTNVAGCDSVVTLHLTILNTSHTDITEMACDSYTWNGEAYSESGDYMQTLTNVNGCDSIVTLHLTISNTDHTDVTEVACDSYIWNGEVYSESGLYTQTLANANGCDSVVTLHLTVNHSSSTTLQATACDSYTWNGVTYYESGDYPVYLTNAVGCDSVVMLHLAINRSDIIEFSATACNSYNWNGITYTESGDFTTYMSNASGCNLVVILHLTINNSDTTDLYASACDSYFWNGTTYHVSGNYVHSFTNVAGCDSVVTLHLTISNTDYTDITEAACDSYTWNGEVYSESGVYMQTLTNVNGCDSIVTLHLTISSTSHTDITEVACDSYTWNGEVYSESGAYTQTFANANGCDSMVTLHLTVNHSDTIDFYATACNSYNWDGVTYTESGDYAHHITMSTGCTLVTILHLTIHDTESSEFSVTTTDSCYIWNGITYCNSGDYVQLLQTVDGCDSMVTLHLTVMVGLDEHNMVNSMILYPNPTNNIVNVQLPIDQMPEISNVEIQLYDMYGKYLQTVPVKDELTPIDLSSYASGVYFVKAVMKGQVLAVRKAVRK